MFDSSTPTHEYLLRHFRARRGLFILGAGTSAGEVQFGRDFLIGPCLDYVRGGSFPVSIPVPTDLSEKLISIAQGVPLSAVFPNQIIRPGTDEFPYQDLIVRMPDSFARLDMKLVLTKGLSFGHPHQNYTVFRLFHPATLMNYNLDGLATKYCGDLHRVVTPHGTVPKEYGSLNSARLVMGVRDYDLRLPPDGLVMSVPESSADGTLANCLDVMMKCEPQFIAIIGYSFGHNASGHDDWITLHQFTSTFRHFAGAIYVIEPHPEPLRDMIADTLESDRVHGIRAYWNILSHVFMEFAYGRTDGQSLDWICEKLVDRHGSQVVFPIA